MTGRKERHLPQTNVQLSHCSACPDVQVTEPEKLGMVLTELNRHGTVADWQRFDAGQAS